MSTSVDEKGGNQFLLDFSRTGDVVLMNRNCLAMKSPICAGLCLLSKIESRFDHVGMIVKLNDLHLKDQPEMQRRIIDPSPSRTYILETNLNGVTLYSAEKRVLQSSAGEIALRPLLMDEKVAEKAEGNLLRHLEALFIIPYRSNIIDLLPSMLSPPDKLDRIDAAHKFTQLQREIDNFEELSNRTNSAVRQTRYREIIAAYKRSQIFLLNFCFSHLKREDAEDPLSVNWKEGHFWVDGHNFTDKMVCSELIGDLWCRAGITCGFPPASSLRPFDFLDDDRFNFVDRESNLGRLHLIKRKINGDDKKDSLAESETSTPSFTTEKITKEVEGEEEKSQKEMEEEEEEEKRRLDFLNQIRCSCGMDALSSLDDIFTDRELIFPRRWLINFHTGDETRFFGLRLFSSGVLFSLCALPCAPFTLRWMEHQIGMFLLRGGVWSLAGWVFAHGVFFSAVQGVLAGALVRLLHKNRNNEMLPPLNNTDRHSYPCKREAGIVDTLHPYYAMGAAFFLSSVAAHVVTYPILNAAIARHFGPISAGPLPFRKLLQGSLFVAPFSVLLPLQMYWIAWYETLGAAVVPSPSSVWRPRVDLAQEHHPRSHHDHYLEQNNNDNNYFYGYCDHYRAIALSSAFVASTGLDVLLYAAQRRARRGFIRSIYDPQPSPSVGRNLFAGYSLRFASNSIIFGLTSTTLHFIFGLV